MIYQLTDLYSLFYLRFIKPGNGQDEHFWSNISERKHDAWAGHAFEMLCLHHIPQIKNRLGISGIETNVQSWYTKPKTDSSGMQKKGELPGQDKLKEKLEKEGKTMEEYLKEKGL